MPSIDVKDFSHRILIKYSLENLNNSERMRFYYSLYGRKKSDKGMVDELNLVKFSRETLLCDPTYIEELREYLQNWKINFTENEIYIK